MRSLAHTIVLLGVALIAVQESAQAQRTNGYISVGRTVRDSITVNDADLMGSGRARAYSFNAVKGQRLSFAVNGKQFTPALALGRQLGTFTHYLTLPQPWDSASGFHFDPGATASYFLIVQAKDATLPARFDVTMYLAPRSLARTDAKSSAACTAGASDCTPSLMEGVLTTRSPVDIRINGHYDLYNFSARQGESVAVFLESDHFDTHLSVGTLRQGVFEALASDDDSGSRTNSRLVVQIPATGDYVVRAAGTSPAEVGAYRIWLGTSDGTTGPLTSDGETDNHAPSCRSRSSDGRWSAWTACNLAGGEQRLAGRIEVRAILPDNALTAEWRYTGTAGSRIEVTLSTSFYGSLKLGRVNDGRFSELASETTRDAGSSAPTGTSNQASASLRLQEDGEYVVRVVTSRMLPKHRYQLALVERLPRTAAPQRRTLQAYVDVHGTLDETDAALADASPYEEWTYDVARGQQLVVTMHSPTFDPILSIGELDTRGNFVMLASNDDVVGDTSKDARVVMSARRNGRYIIRANTFGPDQSGTYTIRLWPSVAAIDSARAGVRSAQSSRDSLNRAVSALDTRARALFAADSFAAAADAGWQRVAGWRQIYGQGVTVASRRGLAGALGSLSWYLLFAKRPSEALPAAEEALRISPLETWIESNRAHALLLLERTIEAAVVYNDYRGQTVDDRPWEQVIKTDLADLEKKSVLTRAQVQLVDGWLAGSALPGGAVWDAKSVAGRWSGKYTCAQGETGLRLTMTAGAMGKVDAVFEFSPIATNPDVPAGSYRMKGWYTPERQLELVGTEWIDKPDETWFMVGLSGRVDSGGDRIEGTVPECRAAFVLERR